MSAYSRSSSRRRSGATRSAWAKSAAACALRVWPAASRAAAHERVRIGLAGLLVARVLARERAPGLDGLAPLVAPQEREGEAAAQAQALGRRAVPDPQALAVEHDGGARLAREGELVGVFRQQLLPPRRQGVDGAAEQVRGVGVAALAGRRPRAAHERVGERLAGLGVLGVGARGSRVQASTAASHWLLHRSAKDEGPVGLAPVLGREVGAAQRLPVEGDRAGGIAREGELVGPFAQDLAALARIELRGAREQGGGLLVGAASRRRAGVRDRLVGGGRGERVRPPGPAEPERAAAGACAFCGATPSAGARAVPARASASACRDLVVAGAAGEDLLQRRDRLAEAAAPQEREGEPPLQALAARPRAGRPAGAPRGRAPPRRRACPNRRSGRRIRAGSRRRRAGTRLDGAAEEGGRVGVPAPLRGLARLADERVGECLAGLLVARIAAQDALPGRDRLLEAAAPQEREGEVALEARPRGRGPVALAQRLLIERHRLGGTARIGGLIGEFRQELLPACRIAARWRGRTGRPHPHCGARRRPGGPIPRAHR